MIFADNIKKYCEAFDLTVSGFEKQCGLSNGSVAKYSRVAKNPSIRTLQRVSQATKIDMMKWITEGGIDGYISKHKGPDKAARQKAK